MLWKVKWKEHICHLEQSALKSATTLSSCRNLFHCPQVAPQQRQAVLKLFWRSRFMKNSLCKSCRFSLCSGTIHKTLHIPSPQGSSYKVVYWWNKSSVSNQQPAWLLVHLLALLVVHNYPIRFLPVSNISFVCVLGARGSTHSSGFTSSGISSASQASQMMSQEARSHGGGIPRGGTTSTVQSICKWQSSSYRWLADDFWEVSSISAQVYIY